MRSDDFMPITGAQLRAARALAGWDAESLSEHSRVAVETITQAEAQNGSVSIAAADMRALRHALEAAGIEFIPENGGGVGVRFAKRSGPPDEGLRPEELTTENDI